MLRNVFTKTLWDQRRGIVIWSLAIAAVGVMYAAFYPLMRNPEMEAVIDAYPPELLDALGFTDITSPAGYLGGTTYGLLGPILMIIFAGMFGTRAIAGEEEAGRMDVLLAHPVGRGRVVVHRAAALLVAVGLAALVLFVAMLAVSGPAEVTEVGPGESRCRVAAARAPRALLRMPGPGTRRDHRKPRRDMGGAGTGRHRHVLCEHARTGGGMAGLDAEPVALLLLLGWETAQQRAADDGRPHPCRRGVGPGGRGGIRIPSTGHRGLTSADDERRPQRLRRVTPVAASRG
jgi:hypothetical protein